MLLSSDGEAIVGLWFEEQRYYPIYLERECSVTELSVFTQAKKWLDIYFTGKEPDFSIPIRFLGTEFRNRVWKILCDIPYGTTVTYKEITAKLAQQAPAYRLSYQAVGGAVGRNEISVIVPCHRVVGCDGNLTGYAAGTEKKLALLNLENADTKGLFIPKKAT